MEIYKIISPVKSHTEFVFYFLISVISASKLGVTLVVYSAVAVDFFLKLLRHLDQLLVNLLEKYLYNLADFWKILNLSI